MKSISKQLSFAALALAIAVPAPAQTAGPIPRMADGHPDLSGIWWTGGDLGSPGYGKVTGAVPATKTFTDLYKPEAAEKMKTLSDRDDPTLHCKPTAFGTLGVRLFDVGALGQIISTPKMMVFLQETFHGYQLVPTDGRAHRALPPTRRGDSVGHWEGDVFVVETTNFSDDSWIFAEGRVSFHSDQMKVVERYQRLDANTLSVDATVTDPKVLREPWVVPTRKLALAPGDQLLPLPCDGEETTQLMENAQSKK
jgi:hypothetical protein